MKDTKEAKIFLDAFSGARKAFQSFVALGKPTEDFASKRDHILMGFINRKITFDTPSSANDSQTTQSKDNNTKARNRKTSDKKTSPTNKTTPRECVRVGAAGAQTRRSMEHHLLHPQILKLLVLLKPADFEAHSSLEQTAPTDLNF